MRPSTWLTTLAVACAVTSSSAVLAACPDLDGDTYCDISVLRGRLTRNLIGSTSLRGMIGLQGEFFTDPAGGDVFDTSAGIVAHVTDGLNFDRTFTWTPIDCVVFASNGHTRCASPDGNVRGLFVSLRRTPQIFSFKIKVKALDIAAPFLRPITLTLTHGAGPIIRKGDVDECKASSKGMYCRSL